MEGEDYDVSATVANANLERRESLQQQKQPNIDRIYQQQYSHSMEKQMEAEQPKEIPAAKVNSLLILCMFSFCTHTRQTWLL